MYRVETVGEDVDASIEALPSGLLSPFAELRVALEVAPWNIGRPYVASNPGGSRTASFGPEDRGMVLYAVEELQQLVLIWQVTVYPDLADSCTEAEPVSPYPRAPSDLWRTIPGAPPITTRAGPRRAKGAGITTREHGRTCVR